MAGSEREEAQQRRAEARQQRRGQAQDEAPAPTTADDSGGADEPLDTVKHAAKVAAAAAAVGAAVGAARAIAGGDDEEGPETAEENPEPVSEARAPEDETAEEEPAEKPQDEPAEEPQAERDERPARTDAPAGDAREVVRSAREQLAALLGSEPESVSGFERTDDGWTVSLEVVEVSRIPESTDVLASYELTLDRDRNLVRYHRGRRYYRAQADAGDGS